MRGADLRAVHMRVRVLGVVLAFGLVLVCLRAAHLAIVDPRGANRGASQTASIWSLPPARGVIYDRDGAELAVTVATPTVFAVPRDVPDPSAAARALAPILERDAGMLERRLQGDGQFAYLSRWVTEEQAAAVVALELPGVAIRREPRRAYPHGSLAAALIGFANIDGVGARGIEQLEDQWLRGRPLEVEVVRDARRRAIATEAVDLTHAAGGDVQLTLDAALQAVAENALAEAIEETGAKGGLVVSLDPRTGDVLALAEAPGFDPNGFRHVSYPDTRSRSFLDAVEPGSTMKPFVIAAALEAGVIGRHASIDCEASGMYRVPGKTLRDFKPYGVLDLGGIIQKSSNIGAAKVGFLVGAERYYESLRRFGFGASTGTGFPEESAGLLRHWKRWQPVDHATVSFGQGMNVTALQLASAIAALADDGQWRRPRLIQARRAPNGRFQPVPATPPRRAVSPEVASTIVEMMERVVGPGGTGRRAGLRDLRVAGKTGTAQKLDPNTGGYSQRNYVAWFAGIAPADDPRVVTVVAIDEPRTAHTGGAVSAPVFARVAATQLARYDILTEPEVVPLTPRVADVAAVATGNEQVRRVGDSVLLPDFLGMSVAQVLEATAGTRLRIETSGTGTAVGQDPAPGTILSGPAQKVHVRFARQVIAAAGDEG